MILWELSYSSTRNWSITQDTGKSLCLVYEYHNATESFVLINIPRPWCSAWFEGKTSPIYHLYPAQVSIISWCDKLLAYVSDPLISSSRAAPYQDSDRRSSIPKSLLISLDLYTETRIRISYTRIIKELLAISVKIREVATKSRSSFDHASRFHLGQYLFSDVRDRGQEIPPGFLPRRSVVSLPLEAFRCRDCIRVVFLLVQLSRAHTNRSNFRRISAPAHVPWRTYPPFTFAAMRAST